MTKTTLLIYLFGAVLFYSVCNAFNYIHSTILRVKTITLSATSTSKLDSNENNNKTVFKGFGKPVDPVEPSYSNGKSRSEKKAEYRKLLKRAKSQSSIHKLVGSSEKDIFKAQRKQGNRGSGGA